MDNYLVSQGFGCLETFFDGANFISDKSKAVRFKLHDARLFVKNKVHLHVIPEFRFKKVNSYSVGDVVLEVQKTYGHAVYKNREIINSHIPPSVTETYGVVVEVHKKKYWPDDGSFYYDLVVLVHDVHKVWSININNHNEYYVRYWWKKS